MVWGLADPTCSKDRKVTHHTQKTNDCTKEVLEKQVPPSFCIGDEPFVKIL